MICLVVLTSNSLLLCKICARGVLANGFLMISCGAISFIEPVSQLSNSAFNAITALRGFPLGRRTGRPRSISQRCTVLIPRPR